MPDVTIDLVNGQITDAVTQTNENTDWNRRFMDLAIFISSWSKDRSTKVGAVIVNDDRRVISMGYNGLTIGLNDKLDLFHERPLKYRVMEHAERNAIYSAARIGTSLIGTTIYTTYHPCADCARAIVQAGIAGLCCPKPNFKDERWGEDFIIADNILSAAKIMKKYIGATGEVMKVCANYRVCTNTGCIHGIPKKFQASQTDLEVTKEECELIESMGTNKIKLSEVE